MTVKRAKELIIPILCGALTALAFSRKEMYPIVFFSLAPMYFIAKQSPFRTFFIYSFSLYFFNSFWLFFAYDFMPLNKILSIILIFILIIFIAFSQGLLLSVPFIFSKKIIRNNTCDAFYFALFYSLGELAQEYLPIAQFPWARLCNIVSPLTEFIQSASLFGGIFVSFIIVLINFLFAEIIAGLIGKNEVVKPVLLICIIFFGNLFYGVKRLEKISLSEEKSVSLIQGNFDGSDKRSLTATELLNEYERIMENCSSKVIILPETAIPVDIMQNETIKRRLSSLAKEHKCVIVTGVIYRENGKVYNSLCAVDKNGDYTPLYHKRILVPFGESFGIFKPIAELFPELSDYGGFSHGESAAPVVTSVGSFGGIICYESAFPHIARSEANEGADVLCIVSNDSWFGKSSALYQHHSHAIMRAVENKRYVLRSSSTAITSVITPYGEIAATAPEYEEYVLNGRYSPVEEKTLYTKTGDIFALAGIAVFIYSAVKAISSLRGNKKPPYQRH